MESKPITVNFQILLKDKLRLAATAAKRGISFSSLVRNALGARDIPVGGKREGSGRKPRTK